MAGLRPDRRSGSRSSTSAWRPDLITFAKGSNSGYVPVGGVDHQRRDRGDIRRPGVPGRADLLRPPAGRGVHRRDHQRDGGGGIVENAARIGADVLGPGLRELAERHPVIGEVRGLGVFWALDLVTDRATRETLAPYGGTLARRWASSPPSAKKRGLLPFINYNRAARRAALHRDRHRGQGGPRHPRRGLQRRRHLLHRLRLVARPVPRARPDAGSWCGASLSHDPDGIMRRPRGLGGR